MAGKIEDSLQAVPASSDNHLEIGGKETVSILIFLTVDGKRRFGKLAFRRFNVSK